MWICSRYGFFSITESSQDKEVMQIRARKHKHLMLLRRRCPALQGKKIVSTVLTDYPYRIFVDRPAAVLVLMHLATDIDYSNFKDAAAEAMPEDEDYRSFLAETWRAGLRLTPARAARRLRSLFTLSSLRSLQHGNA